MTETRYWKKTDHFLQSDSILDQSGHHQMLILDEARQFEHLPQNLLASALRIPAVRFNGHPHRVVENVMRSVGRMINDGVFKLGVVGATLYMVEFKREIQEGSVDWVFGAIYTRNTLTPRFAFEEIPCPDFEVDWLLHMAGDRSISDVADPQVSCNPYPTRFTRILQSDD